MCFEEFFCVEEKMFNKKKKKFEVVSPISGECIPIDQVNDEVFSKKMMGDGFAIKPNGKTNEIVAPIDGTVVALPDSKHAVGIKSTLNNIDILVHIGLDTVALQGKGFTSEVKLNERVNEGDPLIKVDFNKMKKSNIDMTTIVIFTDGYKNKKSIDIGSKKNKIVKSAQPILKQA
jgi:PTS system glucose-specific IIA component